MSKQVLPCLFSCYNVRSMHRLLVIGGVFLLGIGTSQLVSLFFIPQRYNPSIRQPAVTSEATSTSALSLANRSEHVTVTRVIDGDTIELADGRRVRYIGIDTPEIVDPRKPVECFGKESSEENRRLVDSKTVRLEKDVSDTDTYRRLLRYVFVDDQMVNESLVRGGFAHSSTYPPDIKYQDRLQQAEQEARDNKSGLWGSCPLGRNTSNASNIGTTGNANNTPSVSSDSGASCVIKGNISSNGEKIYHLPGCGSYEKTSIDESRGERWFCTEEEAVAAGWRKAKNCP